MGWFTSKQERLKMIQAINPTSKTSLKQQCLFIAKGNLKEAKEFYDYFASDMPNLPETDPIPLTWQQNTAQTVNSVLAWVKDNQDTLAQGYQFIQSIIANRGIPQAPIGAIESSPLPIINEE